MKKIFTLFFQIVVVLIGIAALIFMLWEPHLEGRNVNATVFEVYFKDPFLAYAYAVSITFFAALYQIFKVLGYAGQNKAFSPAGVKALRTIKYCALSLIGFVVAAEAWLIITMGGKDDIAGGVAMGLFMILIFALMATVSGILERVGRNTVGINPKVT